MSWKEIDTGLNDALTNMAIDSHLFGNLLEEKMPWLRFYEFPEQSATYGHFIKPEELFSPNFLNTLDLARRPTGGGFLFHGSDFTFSLAIPVGHPFYASNPLESYQKINQLVLKAVQALSRDSFSLFAESDEKEGDSHKNFCFAKPTIYDLFLKGKKIGGSAERRVRFGLLHQASLNLYWPKGLFQKLESETKSLKKAMQINSATLFSENSSENEIMAFKKALKLALKKEFFQIS